MNYSDVDILKLRSKIKSDQSEIANAEILIENAEKKLQSNIESAYKVLKIYGVGIDEIGELVNKHIK